MATSTRICKVCGKEYPYCKTVLKNGEIFRWQDVACCPKHGSEYFALIAESRSPVATVATIEPDEPADVDEDMDIDEEYAEEEEIDEEDEDE